MSAIECNHREQRSSSISPCKIKNPLPSLTIVYRLQNQRNSQNAFLALLKPMVKMSNIFGDKNEISTTESKLRSTNSSIDNIFTPWSKTNLYKLAVVDLLSLLPLCSFDDFTLAELCSQFPDPQFYSTS